MKYLKPILFAALAAIYFWFPWSMIRSQDQILKKGTYYLFESPSQRPLYLLQERSIALEWDNRLARKRDFIYRQRVFVTIEKDDQGIARFKEVLSEKPAQGDYVETHVQGAPRKKWVYVQIPEYLNSYSLGLTGPAPVSETLRNAVYAGKLDSLEVRMTMGVRILNGQAKVEQVFLNGRPATVFLQDIKLD